MRSLAEMGDERAIKPLIKITEKGRNTKDYLLAMKTLSQLHCEEIYPNILQMAKDDFHTSWVVGMLENFPDKPETVLTLRKIAQSDSEKYIRDKARKALKE